MTDNKNSSEWVMVPSEMTDAMREAAGSADDVDDCYAAVIAAAPPAPAMLNGVEGLMQLARNWCLAWGEWAHDADPGCAKENAAEAALRAALTQALSQQPAACPKCGGTGEADSGGIMPWGAPAMIPCDCQQPAAPSEAVNVIAALTAALEGGK